ncbi:MAG: FMN-binding negative transcriptional regulator [Caulobacteraceae bacterium]
MYAQAEFRERRSEILADAIGRIRLAAIVTASPGEYLVTHAPMIVTRAAGPMTLDAHVARVNPHWRALGDGAAAVAVFQGPHAYISPAWYPSKQEDGRVVPTWNYIVVHAHGRLEAVHDKAWLRTQLERLTDASEAGRSEPWAVTDAPSPYVERMIEGIVGLRLWVDRLEGAWKLSQNRAPADGQGAIAGLATEGGDQGRAVADLMRIAETPT